MQSIGFEIIVFISNEKKTCDEGYDFIYKNQLIGCNTCSGNVFLCNRVSRIHRVNGGVYWINRQVDGVNRLDNFIQAID